MGKPGRPRKIMSTGVGESRVFADPNPEPPLVDLADCHITGADGVVRRVGDFMTDDQIALLHYRMTDEGFEEYNRGKEPRQLAREVSGPVDKAIRHRRDDRLTDMQPWEASDPMRELVEQHIEPGMRPKFLSEAVIKKHGGTTRGFEVVKDEHGDPVRLGTLILGQMPEEKAEARNHFFRQKDAAAVQQIYEGGNSDLLKREERISGRSSGSAVEEDSPEPSGVFESEFGEHLNA